MTAVIYARYYSDNQREESIEGQIRECTAYAEKNGITVIKHYIDRAFSAKTDNRPEFQQMIKDSGKKLFDVVLVWKFDRFARNRFDSANYKMILKKNGVHLISVMEPIAEGSQGILVETLLEGMAEYYSAELSEKVIRGQTENALKGKCTGGTGTIGYKIDDAKFYHLDPLTAPLVLEAFQRYDNGDKMVEIVNFLNDKGVRNMLGGKMTHSSVNTMLKNRRYIGELSFRDIVVPDAIPVIVPKDLFDRVQKRLDKNKRAPACGKADEEYLLTTKLLCGKCGALMFGESGTSATGRTYYYYKCANVKRRKGCNKKTVQKDWLEDLVVRETMKLIQDDAMIDKIVQLVMDVQNQENTTIPLLEKQLREVNKKLDNLMKAIEDGLYTRTTKERLEALEIQKDELTVKIADEKLKKPSFNEDFIRFWLMKFRKFDISQKKQRKALIEIFINAIFLYDDRMLITFNYKDGTQTVRFEDALTADGVEGKSSDLSSSAGPFASQSNNLRVSSIEELFYFIQSFLNNRAAVLARAAALSASVSLFSLCAEAGVLVQQRLEVLAGKALRYLCHLLGCSLRHDESAGASALGAEIDDVVGALDEVEVVFDDDDGIARIHQLLQHLDEAVDIRDVEARSRLVEDIHGLAGAAAGQLIGQLDALGFAARKGRGALSQRDIAQPHIQQGLQFAGDLRLIGEEDYRLLHCHVQHVGDGLFLIFDFQRLPVVTCTLADLAGDVDIRQEVHLDLEDTVALAGLAAASPDVKAEPARAIAPHLGVLCLRKDGADVVEDAGIGGRVGAGCPANGLLVDADDLIHKFEALYPIASACAGTRAVQLTGQRLIQDLIDEARFARARDACHADKLSQRELHINIPQVVLPCPPHREEIAIAGAAGLGHLDALAAR